MKLRQAIEKSIREFYNGKLPDEAIKASDDEYIYTLDYLENLFKEKDEEDVILEMEEEDEDEV
jgi:hypothetical protein